MLRQFKMQHPAPTMFEHQEHEPHLPRDRRHGQAVYRDHLSKVMVQECLPGPAGSSQFAEKPGEFLVFFYSSCPVAASFPAYHIRGGREAAEFAGKDSAQKGNNNEKAR